MELLSQVLISSIDATPKAIEERINKPRLEGKALDVLALQRVRKDRNDFEFCSVARVRC